MSSGSYLLVGHPLSGHGEAPVLERFTCGSDGDGWSYAAVREDPGTGVELGRLQLRLDAAGTTTRLHAEGGGWLLRGGCVGGAVLWRRGQDEREEAAAGFWGTSPSYAVAAVRRLGLAPGQTRPLRLVEVTEPVLATRLVVQSWTRVAERRWSVDDRATGERRELELAGDVVVAGTGLTLTQP